MSARSFISTDEACSLKLRGRIQAAEPETGYNYYQKFIISGKLPALTIIV
jgi:hypothetical protein